MTGLRVLEEVHGHIGVLAAIALLHPAILMRRGQQLSRGATWSVALSSGFALLAFSLGIAIYGSYRTVVKRALFMRDAQAGFLFETKEHLAFVVVSLAAGALVCALAAPKEARDLRKAAAAAYLSSSILAFAVCSLGTYVASIHTFPE